MIRRLGKGLEDIIDTSTNTTSNFVILPISQIRPGSFQPRLSIDEASLEELKASIKRSGVIEPVVVRPIAHGTYELVAGERRLRASQALGMQEIPTIIKTLSDKEALEFSLVENIQRENLNPLEEAKGYARLLDEFGYTQEDIAAAVGKDRSTVSNLLRLLALPEEIRQGLSAQAISLGHAKALLSIEDRSRQLGVYHAAIRQGLSVRQVEGLAGTWMPAKRRRSHRDDPQIKPLEDQLRQALGTKVRITGRRKGGRIIIDYFTAEDLTRLAQILGVSASG